MHAEAARPRLALWLLTPFLTGAVIMAQELVAFRLYAPYFGYSIYVWGSMISVVMAALALGYALGGWVADRRQTDLSLYAIILGSALYQLAVLFTVHGLLRGLASFGEFAGPGLASLLVFAPPMTAMATAGPFLVRLLARSGHIGSAAGKVYAISTVGGIAGVLGTSFFLVPRCGTQLTLEAICALSAATAALGLAPRLGALVPALALFAVALPLVPPPTWPKTTLWAAESPYNLVRVERNGRLLLLKLNDSMGVHTIRNLNGLWTGHYYDDFALGPVLAPSSRLLVLGMGGGGSIAATRILAPDIAIDAVEIDPMVVEAAHRFFGLKTGDQKLRIHVVDARPWLAASRERYDLAHVDLYQGGPYIPFYLVTVEFFAAVREHMTRDGLLMMNLFDDSPRQELLASTVATLERVFPSVAVLSPDYGSHMLLAFASSRPEAAIRARLRNFSGNPALERLARRAADQLVPVHVPPGTAAFTDDLAPVEEMTRRMLNGS